MSDVTIRNARREDCGEIRKLIQELADFEKMSDGPKIDAKILERDGFDTEPPLFQCFVAEDSQNKLVGYALWNMAYSTWLGKRFWLEDIGVSEHCRQKGIGTKLMLQVIKKATELECCTINFNVLGWNPAKQFYKKFGAEDATASDDWHSYVIREDKFGPIAKRGHL